MKQREREERPWGNFQVIECTTEYKVKRITVYPHSRLSLQKHHKRSEVWTVVEGEGTAICCHPSTFSYATPPPDILMQAGDSVKIPVGHMHRMTNKTKENLVFIEVQTGTYFGEDDIVRFRDDYGREFTHPTMIKFQEDNAMGIEITEGTTTLLIGILRDHIYKHTGDEHSDKATHPIEVNLLDLLIEKRENFRGNYYPGYAEGTSHVKPESWLTDSANWEAQDLAEEDE